MKLKDGFVMRYIAGKIIVLPSGDSLDLNKMITLNETGKFIWEQLEKETTEENIINKILASYEATPEQVTACVKEFIEKLKSYDFLENE